MCHVICCTMTAVVVCRSSVGGSPIMAALNTPPARGSSPAAGETKARIRTTKATTACMRGSFRAREAARVPRIIAEAPAARYSMRASRSLVQTTQHPAARRALEDAEAPVILAECQQPREGEAEDATEQRAIGAAVGDDGDGAVGCAGHDPVEGGAHARDEIGHALPL